MVRGFVAIAQRLALVALVATSAGCAIVPRSRMDECQRLTQTLRSENARLKDRALALQSQNRDYVDRAVDDARRLAIQDEVIERLEHSVQAYQDERARLEAAYKQLTANLGVTDSLSDARSSAESANARTSEARGGESLSRRTKGPGGMDDAVAPR
jgi:hypothetical protein